MKNNTDKEHDSFYSSPYTKTDGVVAELIAHYKARGDTGEMLRILLFRSQYGHIDLVPHHP